jgi:hypothetical protein
MFALKGRLKKGKMLRIILSTSKMDKNEDYYRSDY